MYNTLTRLYKSGKVTEQGLANAVIKRWITEEEKQQIILSGTV